MKVIDSIPGLVEKISNTEVNVNLTPSGKKVLSFNGYNTLAEYRTAIGEVDSMTTISFFGQLKDHHSVDPRDRLINELNFLEDRIKRLFLHESFDIVYHRKMDINIDGKSGMDYNDLDPESKKLVDEFVKMQYDTLNHIRNIIQSMLNNYSLIEKLLSNNINKEYDPQTLIISNPKNLPKVLWCGKYTSLITLVYALYLSGDIRLEGDDQTLKTLFYVVQKRLHVAVRNYSGILSRIIVKHNPYYYFQILEGFLKKYIQERLARR